MAWRGAAGLVSPPYFFVLLSRDGPCVPPAPHNATPEPVRAPWAGGTQGPSLLYCHHRHRIARSAVRDGALLRAGLYLAGAIGGAGHELIVARARRCPLRRPENPGVGRELRLQ